jgi:hypothetical protein
LIEVAVVTEISSSVSTGRATMNLMLHALCCVLLFANDVETKRSPKFSFTYDNNTPYLLTALVSIREKTPFGVISA